MFKFLEDSRYPSLGPHLHLLGFTGLWHPQNSPVAKFKLFIFYITTIFFFTQYLKCIVHFKADSLQLILQYAPFHMGIVKACFFQKDYKRWSQLIDYISSIECNQLRREVEQGVEIITEYIKRNRRVTYFFWALAFFSNFTIFTEPYQKNQIIENGTSIYLNIFDGFTPFSSKPPGYYGSMVIQTIFGHIVSAYVVGWDTMIVAIMIFFAGQLKVSRMYCTKLIRSQNSTMTHRNVVNYHRFYLKLVRHQELFNSLISPVMFIYLIVISVNLGVCIIQIVKLQNDLAALLSSCLFVMACLIQLLIFYWHSNEVTEEHVPGAHAEQNHFMASIGALSNVFQQEPTWSEVTSLKVSYGTFESDWPNVNITLRREMYLLGLMTQQRLIFKAGPFNEMSLTTFVSILRTSYSFYTLLSTTN